MVWRTSDELVLLTNRGLIFGNLATKSWQLMCNMALRINSSEQPDLAFVPDGRLLAATTTGLQATADHGCTWQGVAGFASTSTQAMAQDPAVPTRLYVATYGKGGLGGVHVSDDSAASFNRLTMLDDNDFAQELMVAASMPTRLYLSGEVFDTAGNFEHYVARSSDSGKSWERNDVAILMNEVEFQLLAVSPTLPDMLLAKAQDGDDTAPMDRLLVSEDAGKTFTSPLTVKQLFDASFSSDGKQIWVVGIEGFWHSSDGGKSFAQVDGPTRMTCAVEHAGALWAAGWYASGHDGVASAPLGGFDFQGVMAFPDVIETVQCDPSSFTADQCIMSWKDWEYEVLKMLGVYDAGTPGTLDASAPAIVDAGGPDASSPSNAGNGASGTSGAGAAGGGAKRALAGKSASAGKTSAPHAKSGGCAIGSSGHGDTASSWCALASATLWLSDRRRRMLAGNEGPR